MSENSEKEMIGLSENIGNSDDLNDSHEEGQNLNGFFEILYRVAKREGLLETEDKKEKHD